MRPDGPAGLLVVIAATALTASGCARSIRPLDFPVGMFGVPTPAAVEELSGAGFNAVMPVSLSGPSDPFVVAARRRGMLIMTTPLKDSKGGCPSMGSVVWYIYDEPDVHLVSREKLAELDGATHRRCPSDPTAFVVGDGARASEYPGVSNIIMVDWYPVPHLPLESAGNAVAATAGAAGERRVWAVLQAMDWRDFPQRNPKKPRIGRFPTLNEIRFMSYDAVLAGAQGVWYFTFTSAPGHDLLQKPEDFSAVAWVAGELRSMAPIFVRGRPLPLPFAPPDGGGKARAWSYAGRDYLVIENRTAGLWRAPEVVLDPAWRPMFEARRDSRELLTIVDGHYFFKPYQVLVFESRLKPRRLFGG